MAGSTAERELYRALKASYAECKAFGYYPNYFLRMVGEHGPVGAVKELINKENVSSGFERLWLESRLDLTVEAIACRPEFRGLFNAEEIRRAEDRLGALGWRESEPPG
jgi:hypothetical protein